MTDVERVFPGADWDEAPPEEVGIDSAKLEQAMGVLDRVVRAKVHEHETEDGISQALVVRHGRVVWKGPDVDNVHTVWSCSKSFLSMTLGLLIDDGRCALDDPAARYAPELAEHYPTVTLRQFANFTSGYRGAADGDTHAYFDPAEPLYEPGAYFHSSQSTDMLACVLTRIAGEPLRDLFRRRVAGSVGLDPDAWWWGDFGAVKGGPAVCGGSGSFDHGMHTSARQMARVGWLLLNRGAWNGRQLLSEAYVGEMTRPQVAPTVPPLDPQAWYVRLPGAYGLNHWVNGVTPDGRRMWPDAPPGVSAIQGNNNNICFIVPEWDLLLVRMGTDGRINNSTYTEVFAALREALVAQGKGGA
jgi:CubicO group peptidase (beta-lactamase class C family)